MLSIEIQRSCLVLYCLFFLPAFVKTTTRKMVGRGLHYKQIGISSSMSSFYLGITECSMLGLFVERYFIPQINVCVSVHM